jgi:hypothetical protein
MPTPQWWIGVLIEEFLRRLSWFDLLGLELR